MFTSLRSRLWLSYAFVIAAALTIVNEIVKAHGGKIAVHSQSGKGTMFAVLLPLAPK